MLHGGENEKRKGVKRTIRRSSIKDPKAASQNMQVSFKV